MLACYKSISVLVIFLLYQQQLHAFSLLSLLSLAHIQVDPSFFWIAARKKLTKWKLPTIIFKYTFWESGRKARGRKSSKTTTQTQIFVIPFYASVSFLMWKKHARRNLENSVSFSRHSHKHTRILADEFPRKMLFWRKEKPSCAKINFPSLPIAPIAPKSVFCFHSSSSLYVCVEAMIFRLRHREKILCFHAFSAFSSFAWHGWRMCTLELFPFARCCVLKSLVKGCKTEDVKVGNASCDVFFPRKLHCSCGSDINISSSGANFTLSLVLSRACYKIFFSSTSWMRGNSCSNFAVKFLWQIAKWKKQKKYKSV